MADEKRPAASGPKSPKLLKSYRFLVEHETAGTSFTADDVAAATGWKPSTFRDYVSKKLGRFIQRSDQGYKAQGISTFTEDEYVRLMSQKDEVNADPRRPELEPEVEALVRKARESALLALHVYNSPATVFRTEGYAVLMVIGWTALFHAIFEQRRQSYFYMEPDGVTPKTVDGDHKAWELASCMKNYWGDADHAIRRNLDFFIRLRNRIEHRYVPAIDPHVAGECQSLLFNFDELLVGTFGAYHAIRESLAVPLQTGTLRNSAQVEALKTLQSRHFDDVKQFIDAYRKDLPSGVYDDPKYSFRVYLVPKTGNHSATSDLTMEFVKHDPNRPEDMAELQNKITLIKEKHVQVNNANLMSPKDVAREVSKRIGKPFNASSHHPKAWARYKVRPKGDFDPNGCDERYCVPDTRHKDYSYTVAWVELLVSKMTIEEEYKAVVGTKAASTTSVPGTEQAPESVPPRTDTSLN
jgi:hypothetical protein